MYKYKTLADLTRDLIDDQELQAVESITKEFVMSLLDRRGIDFQNLNTMFYSMKPKTEDTWICLDDFRQHAVAVDWKHHEDNNPIMAYLQNAKDKINTIEQIIKSGYVNDRKIVSVELRPYNLSVRLIYERPVELSTLADGIGRIKKSLVSRKRVLEGRQNRYHYLRSQIEKMEEQCDTLLKS